jgi:hypothetical protein
MEKSESIMREYISISDTLRKPVSVRRKVLYNILIEFGEPMNFVRLNKIYLNETYNEVNIVKYLSIDFLSKMA